SILFSNARESPPKVIAISSPGPGEGKTTVACNLAIAYAEINWRVLLIDGDMRRPRLHQIFGVENEKGLATLLGMDRALSAEDLREAATETDSSNLQLLARGKLKGGIVNLLHSPRFEDVLREARKAWD